MRSGSDASFGTALNGPMKRWKENSHVNLPMKKRKVLAGKREIYGGGAATAEELRQMETHQYRPLEKALDDRQ